MTPVGKRLSDCTDLDLWAAGIVSLYSLATDGGVGLSDPFACGFRADDDDHAFGPIVEEDGDFYLVCGRCQRVKFSPFIIVDGVEVSRRPMPEPNPPMPIAWPAPDRARLPKP